MLQKLKIVLNANSEKTGVLYSRDGELEVTQIKRIDNKGIVPA